MPRCLLQALSALVLNTNAMTQWLFTNYSHIKGNDSNRCHFILFVCIILLYLHSQKHLGDNWTFVEELLKLTCNPKVSSASSFKLHNHTIVFIFVIVNHVIRLCVFNNREVLPRSRSGCMPTAVSVSVCCGSRAPVPSPPSGSTTAGIWWVQTFRGNKEIKFCIDWRCNDERCSNMIHYHILCIYTTIRPPLAHITLYKLSLPPLFEKCPVIA